jgi:hypothetical protein
MADANTERLAPEQVLKEHAGEFQRDYVDDALGGVELLRAATRWADGQEESYWEDVKDPANIIKAYKIICYDCGLCGLDGLIYEILDLRIKRFRLPMAFEQDGDHLWLKFYERKLAELRKIITVHEGIEEPCVCLGCEAQRERYGGVAFPSHHDKVTPAMRQVVKLDDRRDG